MEARTLDKGRPLKTEKRLAIATARDLLYPRCIEERIKQATTPEEITRALMQGRLSRC